MNPSLGEHPRFVVPEPETSAPVFDAPTDTKLALIDAGTAPRKKLAYAFSATPRSMKGTVRVTAETDPTNLPEPVSFTIIATPIPTPNGAHLEFRLTRFDLPRVGGRLR